MRLTKKETSDYIHNKMEKIREKMKEKISANPACEEMAYIETHERDELRYEKLGQLEDIEDELGIDLITIFKALKNGIWIKYDADFGRTGKPKIKIVKDTATGLCRRGRTWFIQESETKLKDYGKTWALTKEIWNCYEKEN